MADVLLANSYFLKHDPKEYKNMNLYAPLGTLYAASYLKQKGYGTALFDTMLADSEEDLKRELKKHKPRIFVVYDDVFNYLTKMCLLRMRQAAFRMSEIAKEYGCTVIVCGSDAADNLEKYFEHKADYIICGEGEITLGELADLVFTHTDRDANLINGIAFRNNGDIKKTSKRNVLKNLDVLPFPDWNLVNLERYHDLWFRNHGYFSMNMVTTRGCPFHCNWCAKPIYGQVYNSRSPENVAEEMKMLKEKYSPDHIWFCDDIFGLKPGWVTEFDEAVNRRDAKIGFKCLSRVDLLLQEDNIEHLASAGCESVWVGAESGAQKILNAMEKGTTIDQIYESRKLLAKKNIKTCFFLQFGYTGETKKEIDMTLKMVRDLMPDDIGISVSYPLPGTKFYDRVISQMGEKKNWINSDDFEMMFDGEYSSDFYRVLHKRIHKEFRTRQILRNPVKNFKRLWKLPYYLLGWMWYGSRVSHKGKNIDRINKIDPEPNETGNAIRAFDGLAAAFDEADRSNEIIVWMREQIQKIFLSYFKPGDRVLELNAGTGIDAVSFAERGISVYATDGSEKMVEVLSQKIRDKNLEELISADAIEFSELEKIPESDFDGAISNFGGLNCIKEFNELSEQLSQKLKPGSRFAAAVINKFCPWEIAYYSMKLNPHNAFRRFSKDGIDVNLNGVTMRTYYFSPRNFVKSFSNHFTVEKIYSMGLFTPPPYLLGLYKRFEFAFRLLMRIDNAVKGVFPFNMLGDHFIAVMRRR